MKSTLKSIGYIFIYFLFQIIINIIFSLIAVKNEAYTEIEIMFSCNHDHHRNYTSEYNNIDAWIQINK